MQYWGLNPPQKLSALLAEHKYQLALQLIDQSPSDTDHYHYLQQQRDTVVKQQQQYINQTLSNSQQLQQRYLWPQALDLIQQALANNPESSALTAALRQAQSQQQHFIQQQKIQLAKLEAPALRQAQAIIEPLLLADPKQADYVTIQQLNRLRSLHHLPILSAAAEAAIAQQQWQEAQSLLTAAQQLPLQTDLKELSNTVNKKLNLAAQQQRQSALAQQRQIAAELAQSLDQLIQEQQWPEIKTIATALAQQDTLTEHELSLLNKAQQSLNQHLARIINQGQLHYTKGELQEAINYWLEALQLSPEDNNLKQRLERALRFKQNIDNLP